MASIKARRSRSSGWFLALVVIAGISVLGVAGVVAYLASGGAITIPFSDPPRVFSLSKQVPEAPWSPPAGKIAVPYSARAIPAYTKLTRDDFFDPKTKRFTAYYLDASQVNEAWLKDVKDILGRVLDHEKAAGFVFTKTDFLPEGTRPGLVAGIPAGMRAMRIELSKVRGLYDLKPGDRFDLISTIAVTSDPGGDLRRISGAYADRIAMQASLTTPTKQAAVRVVVQSGVVVTPVQTIEVPVSMSSLSQGSRVSSKPLQEVVIAVHPTEVSALTEAMAVDAALSVVPRSGRPDDPADSVTPGHEPRNPFDASADGETPASLRFVETIDGDKREMVPVPSSDAGKSGAPRAK